MAKKILVELDVNNNKITNVANPVNNGDAVNKDYINETFIDLLNIGEWIYNTITTPAPTTGTFRVDNTLYNASKIFIHYDDVNNFVTDFILNRLKVTNLIHIQQSNDSDKWIKYKIETITDNTTYFTFDISVVNYTSILPSGNCKIYFNENTYTFQEITQNGATTDQHVVFESSFALYDITNNSEVSFKGIDGGFSVENEYDGEVFFIAQSDNIGIGINGKLGTISNSLLTANRNYLLPNASGTFALTSDISSAISTSITGTNNYVSKFTSVNTLGNSIIFDDGTNVGINTTTLNAKLTVNGAINSGDTEPTAIWIKNSSDVDFRQSITIQAGTTTNQRRYIQFLSNSGVRTNLLGFNAQNGFIAYNSTLAYHFISSVEGGATAINSYGTNQVQINKDEGATGNNGLAIYSGVANPTSTDIMYNINSAGLDANSGRYIRALSPDNTNFIKIFNTAGSSYINSTLSLNIYNTANKFQFSDSGLVGRMVIDTSSSTIKVGIGVITGLTDTLQINGTIRSSSFWTTSSGNSQWGTGTTAYGGLTWDTGKATVYSTTGNTLNFGAGTANPSMTLISGGKFGINTILPTANLTIKALGALATDNVLVVRNSTDTQDLFVVLGNGSVFSRGANGVVTNTIYGEGTATAVTGGFNTLFGQNAGNSLTTGNQNTIVGSQAVWLGTGVSNMAVLGMQAFYSTTVGDNSGFGYRAGFSNTTGSYNHYIGSTAGYSNQTAYYNIGIGYQALYANTGNANIGIGHRVLRNVVGTNNVAVGTQAGYGLTGGSDNVIIGTDAMYASISTTKNIAIGTTSLRNITSSNNLAIGVESMFNTTTGSGVALGYRTLYSNIGGQSNVAVGNFALFSNSGGGNNIALGYSAAFSVINTSQNVFIGTNVGYAISTGDGNVFIGGFNTARYIADGTTQIATIASSIHIGAFTKSLADNQTNEIVIGYNAIGNGTNTVTLGATTITKTFFQGNISIGGITNPTAKLHIKAQGALTTDNVIIVRNSADTYNIFSINGAGDLISNRGTINSTFFGENSGRNATGGAITAYGYNAARDVTTATRITAIGYNTLLENTAKNYITAVGPDIFNKTNGTASNLYNVAVGGNIAYGAIFDGTLNTFIGWNIALNGTGGGGNTAIGYQVLRDLTTGSHNIASGYQAMVSNTSGANNIAFGYGALSTNTISGGNVAIGYQALSAATTSYSVAIGYRALFVNSTGVGNVAVGYLASFSTTIGNNNTSMGWQSMWTNTEGSGNTANGANSLALNVTGSNNVAIGSLSLYNNTSGNNTVAIGYQALVNNNANDLVAVGYRAMYLNTSGTANVAIGALSSNSNTTGYGNVTIGNLAGYNNTTGYLNTIVGYQAGNSGVDSRYNVYMGHYAGYLSTASYNTMVGTFACVGNTTGANIVALGYLAGRYLADGTTSMSVSDNSLFLGAYTKTLANNQANEIVIGYNTIGNGSDTVTLGNTLITKTFLSGIVNLNNIGVTTAVKILASDANGNVVDGTSLLTIPAGSGGIYSGNGTVPSTTIVTLTNNLRFKNGDIFSRGYNDTVSNIVYGELVTAIGNTGTNNLIVGYNIGTTITSSSKNTIVGISSASALTTGGENVLIGYNVAPSATTITKNIFIGNQTAYNTTTTSSLNVGIGYQAMYSNLTGSLNVVIGYQALYTATNNNNTIAIGPYAFRNTTSGDGIAIGYLAGYSNQTGSSNVAIGSSALYNTTDSTNIIAIGSSSARFLVDGVTNLTSTQNSIYIGSNTKSYANSQTNEIVIGFNANGNGSNTATIGNTSLSSVLTSGDYEVLLNTRGIVLKSPDNNRWRITIDNSGVLITTSI